MKHVLCLLLGLIIGAAGMCYFKKPQCAMNESHCALRRGMEKLWMEHVVWTRQFIVSSVAGLEDAGVAAERLLKNQDDIGAAVAAYYGDDAGKQLAKLLREHITIAADIVKAALAKDDATVKELDAKWHTNASDIAAFLSKANPYWTAEALTSMLNEHLALTTKELQLRMGGDWKADVENYDKISAQILMMGKDLADGIVAQFPKKF